MKRLLTSVATVGVTVVAAGGLFVGFAGSASAATVPPWEQSGSVDTNELGSLAFFDSSGNPITGGSISSPIAAYVQGSATLRSGDSSASLFGYLPINGTAAGGWHGEQLAGPTAYPDSHAPAPISQTLPVVEPGSHDETIAGLVQDFPNNDTSTTDGYAGMYQLRVYTIGTATQTTTYDSADIQVTGSTWSVVFPAPTLTATTTTLTTTPTSPQVAGTSIQLNASVSPSASGTIQFEDGSADIGTPVTVSGGTASTTDSALTVGAHTLNAVFTPSASSAFSGSTGTAAFTITAPAATATTTALAINPLTATAFTPVTLTANVTKASDSSALASGVGTVKFFDGTTLLGSDAVGTGGVATLTGYADFGVGTHPVTAQFVPADSTVYDASTSPVVDFVGTQGATAPDPQTVDVTIPGGSLTITSPYTPQSPFHLGTAVLDPGDATFTASQPFGSPATPVTGNDGGVTVTDTRAGGQPWTASATVTDFADGSSDVINGQNLTFYNVAAEYYPGNALQTGDVTTTNVGNSAVYGATASGSDGLKGGPHAFATAADGDGTVNIDGQLKLTAPSSTPAGTYTATLTFTIA